MKGWRPIKSKQAALGAGLAMLMLAQLAAAQSMPTMKDLWSGDAAWRLERIWTEGELGSMADGVHMEIINGVWYLFDRKVYWGQRCDSDSPLNDMLGIQVRRSYDRGASWSSPVDVIVPTAGTPWACGATDGDAYYDAVNNRWHYLFQCIGTDDTWRGCYATRSGSDPMGSFTPHPVPVIESRSLWSKICNTSTDDCVRLAGGVNRVYDEGTFEIFAHDGSYYWVSFHGFDGQRGYRGIAKTRDFFTWIAGDSSYGVPRDAVLDREDALDWRETWGATGPVGVGQGSILYDSGSYYMINEVSDTSLLCTPGQRWDYGLFRSSSLSSTSWEQYPGTNPIVYSSDESRACNVQYARLFRDPGNATTYMMFSRKTSEAAYAGIYLYSLRWTSNRLANGDLWMAVANHWNRMPAGGPTNYIGIRNPNRSSDGNQYLSMNCGAPSCAPGQSVYQDVDVSTDAGRSFTFGANIATDGGAGSITLAAHQLDSSFAIVDQDLVSISAGTTYSHHSGSGIIHPNARTLRFEMYLNAAVGYRADEMYVNIGDAGPVPFCEGALVWSQDQLGHVIGRADGDGWSANVAQDPAGFLQYGPYTTSVSPGSHSAMWTLMIDNNTADNDTILRLEIVDSSDNQYILASREVRRMDWTAAMSYECFDVPFSLDSWRAGHALELRVWWYDKAYVNELKTSID